MKSSGVSVILPARRPGRVLLTSAKSILSQLNDETDELLIIFDADDELTGLTVAELGSSVARGLRLGQPSSLATKLNYGLSQARNENVARMDADDVALPWRLSRQRRLYDSLGGAIFSPSIVFGRQLRPFPVLPQPPVQLGHSDFLHSLLFTNPAVHPTLFTSKSSILNLGGYEDVPGEDLNLWLRMGVAGYSLHRDWIPSLLYRYSPTSMSHGLGNPLAENAAEQAKPLRLELLSLLLGKDFDPSLSYERNLRRFLQLNPTNWKIKLEKLDLKLNK